MLELPESIEQGRCRGDGCLSRRRWCVPVPCALEQVHAQPPLQAAETSKCGGMIDPHVARRAGERPRFADCPNETQVFETD